MLPLLAIDEHSYQSRRQSVERSVCLLSWFFQVPSAASLTTTHTHTPLSLSHTHTHTHLSFSLSRWLWIPVYSLGLQWAQRGALLGLWPARKEAYCWRPFRDCRVLEHTRTKVLIHTFTHTALKPNFFFFFSFLFFSFLSFFLFFFFFLIIVNQLLSLLQEARCPPFVFGFTSTLAPILAVSRNFINLFGNIGFHVCIY